MSEVTKKGSKPGVFNKLNGQSQYVDDRTRAEKVAEIAAEKRKGMILVPIVKKSAMGMLHPCWTYVKPEKAIEMGFAHLVKQQQTV
jgi:hypothetical protein